MATIKDIAAKAQVSIWTVSKVLNNSSQARIAPATREKILNLAREMGYRGDDMARAVRTGRARVIGFAAKATPSSYAFSLLSGVMAVADREDYSVKLFNLHKNSTPRQLAAAAAEQRISAFVGYSLGESFTADFYRLLKKQSVPLAVVSNEYVPEDCIHVNSDDRGGAFLAVEHLYNLGHRRLAYLGCSTDSSFARQRHDGFMTALKHFSLTSQGRCFISSQSLKDSFSYVLELSQQAREADFPTAFFCEGDQFALMLSQSLLKYGIAVPQRVSIVGFSNSTFASNVLPPLTTVAEPHEQMGRRSVETLLKSLRKEPYELKQLIETSLVIRKSTAEPYCD